MRILALDVATKCGWAFQDSDMDITSGVWDLSIKRDESGGMRLLRFKSKLKEIRVTFCIDLVVFEAARHAGPNMQGALVVQAELQGVLKSWCDVHKIDYRGYSPKEIKKHATGKGSANKEKMIEAAKLKWPLVNIIDDNQADALHLLSLVKTELGE